MSVKETRCPICGTRNEEGAESCKMCKTILTKKDGGKTKVKAPKSRGKTITIVDIEDPLTRKKLEELTMIPGVSRKKALLLYQSGICSIEDFLQKAFHGEKLSTNYTRTVANKLLVRSMKGKKKKTEMPCPSCQAPNPMDAERCHVCNFDIKAEMDSVSMSSITGKMDEAVEDIMSDLSKSEDFGALPEDLKAELAMAVGSDDIDIDMEKPKAVDNLGLDPDSIDVQEHEAEQAETLEGPQEEAEEGEEPPAAEVPEPEQKTEEPTKQSPAPTKAAKQEAPQPPAKKSQQTEQAAPAKQADPKQEKVRKVLTDKMEQWRKAGYDVAPLEQHLGDVEAFKAKAKEVLGQGKVIKIRCAKQLDMWREKGFDVSELEPLLETDVAEFMERAKDILKKQKK